MPTLKPKNGKSLMRLILTSSVNGRRHPTLALLPKALPAVDDLDVTLTEISHRSRAVVGSLVVRVLDAVPEQRQHRRVVTFSPNISLRASRLSTQSAPACSITEYIQFIYPHPSPSPPPPKLRALSKSHAPDPVQKCRPTFSLSAHSNVWF